MPAREILHKDEAGQQVRYVASLERIGAINLPIAVISFKTLVSFGCYHRATPNGSGHALRRRFACVDDTSIDLLGFRAATTPLGTRLGLRHQAAIGPVDQW